MQWRPCLFLLSLPSTEKKGKERANETQGKREKKSNMGKDWSNLHVYKGIAITTKTINHFFTRSHAHTSDDPVDFDRVTAWACLFISQSSLMHYWHRRQLDIGRFAFSPSLSAPASVGDDIETRFDIERKSWDRQCDDGFACCIWWEQYKTTITRKMYGRDGGREREGEKANRPMSNCRLCQ